ncbi:hypothetical protein ACUOCP_17425, partial [Escherichia sp. R-CC3]
MSDYQMFEVQVSQVEPLTEQVKRFTLVATDGIFFQTHRNQLRFVAI